MTYKNFFILNNISIIHIYCYKSCPKKNMNKNNDNIEEYKEQDDKKDEKEIIKENQKKYKNNVTLYNIDVFKDTKKQCTENEFLKNIISKSIESQHFYKENEDLHKKVKDYTVKNNDKNNIEFQKQKTIESALYYLNKEKNNPRIAILNFADWTLKGGLVKSGLKTQEESICRCTTLYQNLIADNVKDYYENHRKACGGKNKQHEARAKANDDLIYSPNVQIIKDDVNDWNVKDLEKNTNRSISVITCAAPWNITCGIKFTNKEIFDIHYKKAKRILDVSINDNVDIIILGAYGCGDFYNNPEYVAKAYKKVLIEEGYQKYFKKVVFAIPIINNDFKNYNTFFKVFKNN